MSAKTYKASHTQPSQIDRVRLREAAERVYPCMAEQLCLSIADGVSYDRQKAVHGKMWLNRCDFYGYRRKVIDEYVERGG